ncbi:MAG: hypothetical protein K6G73_12540 [Marinilabiliaceae bacterium]|nr:hypothetical protein [Marinilabiliaceae bacterium]
MENLYTIDELAVRWNKKPDTIRHACRNNQVRWTKEKKFLGKRTYDIYAIPDSAVLEYEAQHGITPIFPKATIQEVFPENGTADEMIAYEKRRSLIMHKEECATIMKKVAKIRSNVGSDYIERYCVSTYAVR